MRFLARKTFRFAQADGDGAEYDKPPRWSGKPKGSRLFVWGGR